MVFRSSRCMSFLVSSQMSCSAMHADKFVVMSTAFIFRFMLLFHLVLSFDSVLKPVVQNCILCILCIDGFSAGCAANLGTFQLCLS